MEKEQRYILMYSCSENGKFTSFLPFDLDRDEDRRLFEYLKNNNQNDKMLEIPITSDVFQYLLDLDTDDVYNDTISIFFKKYRLEEWVV